VRRGVYACGAGAPLPSRVAHPGYSATAATKPARLSGGAALVSLSGATIEASVVVPPCEPPMRPHPPAIDIGQCPQIGERRIRVADAPRGGHLGPAGRWVGTHATAWPRVVKLSGRKATYPRPTNSLAQRPGAPLEVGPRPLQSCMITTAGKGPGPSGLDTVAGICSEAPLGAVVGMDRPEVVPMQPPRNKQASTSNINLVQ